MHEILNIALHGMQQDMLRLNHVGMNLTNATTPGYQRQVVALRPYQGVTLGGGTLVPNLSFEATLALQQQSQIYPDAGNATARVVTDSRPGTLKATGQPLDVALTAPGYFEVTTPDGPAYTRAGQFQLDARGRMVNALGYPVMGVSGEIVLNTPNPVIEPNGQIRENNRQIAQLKIVQFEEPSSIERLGDGLVTSAGATRTLADSDVQLRQGFVENANVSSMHEMVQLIEVMRHFESMQRMAQGYDDMLGSSIRKLGDL
jgi:flagellar basal-body rod protein FlgG